MPHDCAYTKHLQWLRLQNPGGVAVVGLRRGAWGVANQFRSRRMGCLTPSLLNRARELRTPALAREAGTSPLTPPASAAVPSGVC